MTVTLNVAVPNDAAPVAYPVLVSFGGDTVRMALSVRPPVSARMMLPNGKQNTLWIDLENFTPGPPYALHGAGVGSGLENERETEAARNARTASQRSGSRSL